MNILPLLRISTSISRASFLSSRAHRDKDHLLESKWSSKKDSISDKPGDSKFFSVHMTQADSVRPDLLPEDQKVDFLNTPNIGVIVHPKYRRAFAALSIQEKTQQAIIQVQQEIEAMETAERSTEAKQPLTELPTNWDAEEEDYHAWMEDAATLPEFKRACSDVPIQRAFVKVKTQSSLEAGFHAVDSLLYMADISHGFIDIKVLDILLDQCEAERNHQAIYNVLERALSDQLSSQITPNFFKRCIAVARHIEAPLDACVEALAEFLSHSPVVKRPLDNNWRSIALTLIDILPPNLKDTERLRACL